MITEINRLKNNCTLVAAKEVTGKSDEEVIQAFLNNGYQWNRGTYVHQYMKAINELGFKSMSIALPCGYQTFQTKGGFYKKAVTGLTVAQFSKLHKDGTYVVSTGGHAFVIRNGIVVDPNFTLDGPRRRRRLVCAHLILDAAPTTLTVAKPQRLRRNADPMVSFVPLLKGKRRQAENEARNYVYFNGKLIDKSYYIRLSELTANTTYTRGDAAWDIKRRRMIILDEEARA